MSATTTPPTVPEDAVATLGEVEQAGHAHVATASFLASRVAPTGGYAVALAGGVALARLGGRAGMRAGYGASIAAMLQTIAIMGPSRVSIPLTQAASAPLLGRMHARGRSVASRVAACAAIRVTDQIAMTSFYIWVIVGGLGPYSDTYDRLLGWVPGAPTGEVAALALSLAVLLAWTAGATVVQVLVYQRGVERWPADATTTEAEPVAPPAVRTWRGRYDPRVVVACGAVAFCALLASTDWIVLGAVSAWLALAWATARADRGPVRAGLILAAVLGAGPLVAGLIGGGAVLVVLERTVRAVLLVLVAVWLRAAAGEDGVREVTRRALQRLRRLPAARETSSFLDRLGAEGSLEGSGRALAGAVRDTPREAAPLADAVLGWIACETRDFVLPAPAPRARLRARAVDAVVFAGVLAAAGLLLLI